MFARLRLIAFTVSLLSVGSWIPAGAQSPTVTLDAEQTTIPIAYNASQADGVLDVMFTGITAAEITLRAAPLTQGDARGFVHFPENGGRDTVRLDVEKLHCQAGKPCSISYDVTEMWPPGLYQGQVEAWGPEGKIASTLISAIRLPLSFHPVVTSDFMHDGRISVDVEGSTPATFQLSVLNPTGSPPHHFAMLCPQAGASGCPASGKETSPGGLSFQPSNFWLEPGATQAVSVVVQPCPTNPCSATMMIGDADHRDLVTQTVISVNQYRSVLGRQAWLFGAAVLGSVISVLLNNLFPTTRAKQAVRGELRRIEDTLRDCRNSGAALLDVLNSEATRLKLVLRQVSFANSSKESALQDVRQATTVLHRSGCAHIGSRGPSG